MLKKARHILTILHTARLTCIPLFFEKVRNKNWQQSIISYAALKTEAAVSKYFFQIGVLKNFTVSKWKHMSRSLF